MPALLFDLDGTLVDLLTAGRKNGLAVGLLSAGYGPHELEGAGASASIKIRQICWHTLRTWEFQGEQLGATKRLRAVPARSGFRAALASQYNLEAPSPAASAGTLFHDESVRR